MSLFIARLESYKLFRHPMTLVIFALSIGLMWLFFYRLLVDYLTLMQNALVQGSRHASLGLEVIKPFFSWSIVIFAFMLPIFTSNAFSVEFQQKTFVVWASHRIHPMSLVIGKFLSVLGITACLLFAMLVMIFILHIETALDWGLVIGGCSAVMGVSAALISFGIFISCLVISPLLAIGITVIGNMMWLLIEWLSPFSYSTLPTSDISLLGHSFHLLHGDFQSHDIIFYFLFSAFWLSMSSRLIAYKLKRVPR
jgi:ABC-type transport system involved in multi-copper enzyme maturation permease subunit